MQIRTREMHQHSEYGVAAHWRYKEGAQKGVRRDPDVRRKIAWLRQVLDWKDAVADAVANGSPRSRSSLFTDTIYVLTPQGKVVDLPRGATPVDFAYAVHTSLGHRCRGAKVDGAMVPLNYALKNGQQVEIVTAKQGGPSRDWLNPELGYVHSHRARTKVRQWFKAQQHEETVAQGRAIVERELARAGATAVNLDALAAKAGFEQGRRTLRRGRARRDQLAADADRDPGAVAAAGAAPRAGAASRKCSLRQSKAAGAGSGILVVGVDRLMTGLARCCKPAPPDPIVGFVTRGKGVTIHRAELHQRRAHARAQPERLITADWGAPRDEVFPVDIVRRGDGPAGPAARHLGGPLAREDQRHRGQHADAQHAHADGVHARGAEPRGAEARARARPRRAGRRVGDAALSRRPIGDRRRGACQRRRSPAGRARRATRRCRASRPRSRTRPSSQAVDPGVQRQRLAAPPRVLHDRRARDVHHLLDHVELAEPVDARDLVGKARRAAPRAARRRPARGAASCRSGRAACPRSAARTPPQP